MLKFGTELFKFVSYLEMLVIQLNLLVIKPHLKVTVKEQQEWKIPPCISNWKNARGYTIPLDKRLAADGRGLQVNLHYYLLSKT